MKPLATKDLILALIIGMIIGGLLPSDCIQHGSASDRELYMIRKELERMRGCLCFK